MPKLTASERLARKTVITPGCWPFVGSRLPKGYGTITLRTAQGVKTVYAHRVAWEREHGPIPEGMEIDHLCNNPSCVRLDHLQCVTPMQNNRRSASVSALYGRRDRCKHGHEFTLENTRPGPRNSRRCRACDRTRAAAKRAGGKQWQN